MPDFGSKLGDTALWSAIGAAVLGTCLKLVAWTQLWLRRRDKSPITK